MKIGDGKFEVRNSKSKNRVRLVMVGASNARDGADSPLEIRDRSLGLVVFGVTEILIGVCCVLLVPLSLAAALLVGTADIPATVSAMFLYTVVAAVFTWLGVGSIRARRWACELTLSLSWIWLVTGICSIAAAVLLVPAMLRGMAAGSDLPTNFVLVVSLVVFGVIGFLYVLLPGAFVLFYRSPHVTATCRIRDPQPQWTDDLPPRLLTLVIVWALAAVSVLVMPAYGFVVPFFGVVLNGASGAAVWAAILAGCVVLAWGSSRRAPWAWWGGVVAIILATLSSVITAVRVDPAAFILAMDLPEQQTALLSGITMPGRWVMALVWVVVWGTFLAYLMSVRRFFLPMPKELDG
jgi:hypothetical protein